MRRLANRSHRRVLVADGKVGMTGGVGIAEEWTGDAEDQDHWRDTHVRLKGPVVRHLQGCFTEALAEAAERGVDVRILVPGPFIDKGFVRVAGRDSYSDLLEAGVRLFEFQPTMLHAKSLTVDGCWSSVGTVNFDNRSFQLHDEIMVGVWDQHFASLLTEQFEKDMERSDEIGEERWAGRGLRMRATEASMRVFRREL